MKIRDTEELSGVSDPAWPQVERLISQAAAPARVVLCRSAQDGAEALYRLQVTVASTLGALAANCGALLIDSGWLRLLGSGVDGLPSLPEASGLGDPTDSSTPPGHMVVGFDVLGGTFAINGGALPGSRGEVCYFGPDTLTWTPIGLSGHSQLLRWSLAGGLTETFADLRWPGWERDMPAGAAEGVAAYPPPWSAQAHGGMAVRRSVVPLRELIGFHEEAARQLADVPDGQAVRLRITD